MKKPQSRNPELSIVIVNFNGWKWVEKCLDSFSLLNDWERWKSLLEVIVVDNASTDDSLKHLRKISWISLIEASENRGFSAGNNLGIQRAAAPVVMLLNSDTEFPKDADLSLLLQNFLDPKVAVVTPKVEFPNGELDHACHRGFPTPWNALMYFSGVAKLFPHWKAVAGYKRSWQDLDSKHFIEACSGAAMLVRQTAIKKVGMLDEDYFMYAEDIDWCYRFVQAGYQVLYDPSVQVVHHKHKSGLQSVKWETKELTTRAFFDTMKLFMEKHYQEKYPKFVLWVSSVMIDLLKYWKLTSERIKYERAVPAQRDTA